MSNGTGMHRRSKEEAGKSDERQINLKTTMNSQTTIEQENIHWRGDMDDDCTAEWNGLLLRAEWSRGEGTDAIWWWAVISIETGEQLDTSNTHSHTATTGEDARKCAEEAARPWLLAKGYNKYSPLELHNKRNLKGLR